MSQLALRCVDLTKGFNGSQAVSGLSLEVTQGEVLALLGPSGCGKTTTLRLIAGFEVPESGTIEVGGQLVSGPSTFVPPEKRHIGIVFQDYALFPHLTVAENVAFGLPKGQRWEARMRMVLSMVGLSQLQSRMPHELSGGEQQRVALARALAPDPAILLLDEPFSNLDARLRQQVREEVKEVLELSGATTLFVTHDQEEALYLGDRVAILNQGHLEQVGTSQAIYRTPTTSYVARFVGMADFLPVTYRDGAPWTEVGALDHARVPGPTDGLEVMVRPDYLTFLPSEEGQARIISRFFQGANTLYRILLDSGDIVHSLQPNLRQFRVGTRVRVHLDPAHRFIFFRDGKAVIETSEGEPGTEPSE